MLNFLTTTTVCGFSLYHVLAFFLIYSCTGWCLEVIFAAATTGQLVNRGFLNGPVCPIYGFGMVIVLFALTPLQGSVLLLYIGGVILPSALELVGGWALYKLYHTRWWDYSNRRWNLDGYICLSASALWGLLGVVMVKWGNPLLTWLYDLIPAPARQIVLWVLVGVVAVDGLASVLTLAGVVHKLPALENTSRTLNAVSARMGGWILSRTERRIQKAYPQASFVHKKREKATVFAAGCSFSKLFLLFFIGAFLGDIVETIFCRVTAGVWMSRSSVVWGPFSLVWGLALALATLLLYRYKDKPASFLFVAGTVLGGAYEYLCSVFTELVFGTVFWDYSKIPFNLLYCFFWGFAAVAWFRLVYPHFSRWIEAIPITPGRIITAVLVVFMVANIGVSALAMGRYSQRAQGLPATASWQVWMDEHYPDETMKRIYPNAKRTD